MNKKEFGKRIKNAREARGWTQRQLAEMVGIHQPQICLYEQGKSDFSLSIIEKFEEALGRPLLAPVFRVDKGRRLYIAYGSNLSLDQMSYRCPDAYPIGRGVIHDYRLVFRHVLTIEPYRGGEVPVVVWSISARDERSLDVYEGFPRLYRKETLNIGVQMFCGPTVSASGIVYIMNDGRHPVGAPTGDYYATCAEGYLRFGFDLKYLRKAYGVDILPYKAKRGRYA